MFNQNKLKNMKNTITYVIGLVIAGTLLTACSHQQDQQSLKAMLKDAEQQKMILAVMEEDHAISDTYISKMLENDQTTSMMVDKLITAASKDSVLAGKISGMITKFPDLVLLTTHHLMPVINADEHLCDGFCDHAMEHTKIAEGMCHKMKANEAMSCCH